MLGPQNTQEELLAAFHQDAQWWKSMVGYIENEIQFINRLLDSNAFKEKTPNLFERLQQFKHEISTKAEETKKFKKETTQYESTLRGILECEDISCDAYYLENHKDLKDRFERFYRSFNDHIAGIFNYTGSIL